MRSLSRWRWALCSWEAVPSMQSRFRAEPVPPPAGVFVEPPPVVVVPAPRVWWGWHADGIATGADAGMKMLRACQARRSSESSSVRA